MIFVSDLDLESISGGQEPNAGFDLGRGLGWIVRTLEEMKNQWVKDTLQLPQTGVKTWN